MRRTALLSVYYKQGLEDLARFLLDREFDLLSTGGTFRQLSQTFAKEAEEDRIIQVSDLTGFPEILDGRVKTLHPKIHGGLLARRDKPEHLAELAKYQIPTIDLVVVNLYPFHLAVDKLENNGEKDKSKSEDDQAASLLEEAQELIDIGGVTLMRAAAKNFQHVVILTDPEDYVQFMEEYDQLMPVGDYRNKVCRQLAAKAFEATSEYDRMISNYLDCSTSMEQEQTERAGQSVSGPGRQYVEQLALKYGCNPHQNRAGLYNFTPGQECPIKVLNGAPGYINLLDAIGAWQLVREVSRAMPIKRTVNDERGGSMEISLPGICAASFKHTSPAGVGLPVPLDEILQTVYQVNNCGNMSKLALAYLRARNSDPMSSFGDFIGLSHECDEATASLIKREVSDGVIAPGYTEKALELLRSKRGGNYLVLQIDPAYENEAEMEYRELFGLALAQPPNRAEVTGDVFNCTSNDSDGDSVSIPEAARRDMLLANITLKYAQSNNVAMAVDGQVVAIASGQQSRVDCTKLCARKLRTWYLRQHPKSLKLFHLFRSDQPVKRQDKINAIVRYVEGDFTEIERREWLNLFWKEPEPLTEEEKNEWMIGITMRYETGVSMASDAFFPFRDNIDHASQVGVKHVIQPGGSLADEAVGEACRQYGMTMTTTGVRQFTH